MQKLLTEAKGLGIDVYFKDLKKEGYSIIELKTIFINQNLDEDDAKKVLLHELAHFKLHADYLALYDKSTYHSKMENEADFSAVSYIINENGNEYNYSQLIEKFGMGMGYDIKFVK